MTVLDIMLAATLLTVVCFISKTSGSIKVLGDLSVVPTRTPEVISRTAFLLPHAVVNTSILYGFSDIFLEINLMKFQIWRPVGGSEYKLMHEWSYTPKTVNNREYIYMRDLADGKCVDVEPGDRMALFVPEAPAAIAFMFNPTEAKASQYTEKDEDEDQPLIGVIRQFDQLGFPYAFGAAAYLDTDLSKYNTIKCLDEVKIPGAHETNQGPVGATGPTGPTGPAGAIGAPGPRGNNGQQGADGQDGAMGPAGPAGSPGSQGVQGQQGAPGADNNQGREQAIDTLYDPDCTWCADVLDPHLILGMIIWLAVISIALIILIVTHCFRRCCSGPKAEYRNGMSDKTDLWKKYDNIGFDNGASKQAEEGRTEF